MDVSRSPIHDLAAASGAIFAQQQGWELPQSFGDVPSEYAAAKRCAALYDSTHVGRLKATGADVLDLLNRLSTNLIDRIEVGSGARTVLTDERGRILDLTLVINMGSHILLVVGPQNREKVSEWIDKYTIVDDVALEDITLKTAMFTILGQEAEIVLSSLTGAGTGAGVGGLDLYQWMDATIGRSPVQVLRTGSPSLPAYEVIASPEEAPALWSELKDAGTVTIGSEAYEAVRIEAGIPGHSSELIDTYNPLEAGLWDSISFNKGCYIGQEVIARLDTYGKVQRHLVSISFPADAHVEDGLKLVHAGKEVGHITSVARLPETGGFLGLGYLRKEAAALGTKVTSGDDQGWQAEVVGLTSGAGPDPDS